MISRRGIIVTGIVLTAITLASFMVWFIPYDVDQILIVSNYEQYLDGVKNIQEILQESTQLEYDKLLRGEILPSEYVSSSEITSSQMTSQIAEFVTSKPSEPWQESYINYMESMKKFDEYLTETVVLASVIQDGGSEQEKTNVMSKIDEILEQSREFARLSDATRP